MIKRFVFSTPDGRTLYSPDINMELPTESAEFEIRLEHMTFFEEGPLLNGNGTPKTDIDGKTICEFTESDFKGQGEIKVLFLVETEGVGLQQVPINANLTLVNVSMGGDESA